jgi:hypothetical protein
MCQIISDPTMFLLGFLWGIVVSLIVAIGYDTVWVISVKGYNKLKEKIKDSCK